MTLFEVRVDMENKIFELSGKQLCVARCPADVHKLCQYLGFWVHTF